MYLFHIATTHTCIYSCAPLR